MEVSKCTTMIIITTIISFFNADEGTTKEIRLPETELSSVTLLLDSDDEMSDFF